MLRAGHGGSCGFSAGKFSARCCGSFSNGAGSCCKGAKKEGDNIPLLPYRTARLLDRTVEIMLQLFLVLSLLLKEEKNGNGSSRQSGDCGEYSDKYGESILFQIRHLRRNQCKTSRGSGTASFPGLTRCFLIPMIPNFGEKVNRKAIRAFKIHLFAESREIKKAELSLCLF